MSTKIQWTNETWNPLAGCSKVSDGCKNCYAIKDAVRLSENTNPKIRAKYEGTTKDGNNWTGKINLASDDVLTQPLRWTRPRQIFVNSMSDLFHENVPDEWIDRIFAVIAMSAHHIFQILTKRPERMKEYFSKVEERRTNIGGWIKGNFRQNVNDKDWAYLTTFPIENVWLGVSVENQKTADERIPLLLETPAAIRWLSCEPLLEEVDLTNLRIVYPVKLDALTGAFFSQNGAIITDKDVPEIGNKIDWVVVGGESGTNHRKCDVNWIRSIARQCHAVDVPVFIKQLGGTVIGAIEDFPNKRRWVSSYSNVSGPILKHKKGGNISEFPIDLQVREFPNGAQNTEA
jgi:protein gp37